MSICTRSLRISRALCLVCIAYYSVSSASALTVMEAAEHTGVGELTKSIDTLIASSIRENTVLYGLASWYNSIDYYLVGPDSLQKIEEGETVKLGETNTLAVTGRFRVMLIHAPGLSISLQQSQLVFGDRGPRNANDLLVQVLNKSELAAVSAVLDRLRYRHLWTPLAWLARLIESVLIFLHQHITSDWSLVIIVFAVLLKLFMLPINLVTMRSQRQVSRIQSLLQPRLEEIKSKYVAEEAHNRMMAAYRDLGVTPFYTLKPMLSSFIQIPVLISLFNVLGEMSQLEGAAFLWIENLAYPDVIARLPLQLPIVGDRISLLPVIMTMVTLAATWLHENPHAPLEQVRREKRNLLLMAAAFFVLFYPFPAAMVFYWTLANILQFIQQRVYRL